MPNLSVLVVPQRQHATAKVSVDATGGITDVQIMDGGSAYGIGNTMNVVGIATTTGHSKAVVTVTNIYDNVGDIVRVSGVTSDTYKPYNTLYRITEVVVGGAKSFTAISDPTIQELPRLVLVLLCLLRQLHI